MPAEEGALSLAGQEAEVLALALGGDRQAGAGGQLAHLGLRQVGEREAKRGQRIRAERGEHVRLVLGRVGRRREQRPGAVVDDARVVAGGQRGRPNPPREGEHRVDPHLAVADHAGVRGPARLVPAQEALDHGVAKRLLQVERQVRQAQPVGQRPGADDRLRRAAASRPIRVPVGPQLQRHRDHLGAAAALEQRRDGGVDAAADRHQHAVCARRRVGEALARRGRGAERPVERVGGQLGGVAALRREPAQLGGNLRRPDPRRLQHAGALDRLGDRGARGHRRRAALGVEARRDHAASLDRERDADEVPARRASRGAAEGAVGRRPAP